MLASICQRIWESTLELVSSLELTAEAKASSFAWLLCLLCVSLPRLLTGARSTRVKCLVRAQNVDQWLFVGNSVQTSLWVNTSIFAVRNQ